MVLLDFCLLFQWTESKAFLEYFGSWGAYNEILAMLYMLVKSAAAWRHNKMTSHCDYSAVAIRAETEEEKLTPYK